MKKDKSSHNPSDARKKQRTAVRPLPNTTSDRAIDQAIEEILTPSWAWRMLIKG